MAGASRGLPVPTAERIAADVGLVGSCGSWRRRASTGPPARATHHNQVLPRWGTLRQMLHLRQMRHLHQVRSQTSGIGHNCVRSAIQLVELPEVKHVCPSGLQPCIVSSKPATFTGRTNRGDVGRQRVRPRTSLLAGALILPRWRGFATGAPLTQKRHLRQKRHAKFVVSSR